MEEEIAEIPGEDNSFERESTENEAENAEASAEPSIDAGEAAADSDEIQREEADGGIGSENENADPSEK